ncbi:MAG TPA: hypothetical protein DEP72_08905 [Clostridiales bacterium]|nr:MAG: hypothetical protein A2Y18_03845 [Clostridiales bacterium GWD2_32_19]HCC08258.1 hypothetical protein [Clostridiales bacterium]
MNNIVAGKDLEGRIIGIYVKNDVASFEWDKTIKELGIDIKCNTDVIRKKVLYGEHVYKHYIYTKWLIDSKLIERSILISSDAMDVLDSKKYNDGLINPINNADILNVIRINKDVNPVLKEVSESAECLFGEDKLDAKMGKDNVDTSSLTKEDIFSLEMESMCCS